VASAEDEDDGGDLGALAGGFGNASKLICDCNARFWREIGVRPLVACIGMTDCVFGNGLKDPMEAGVCGGRSVTRRTAGLGLAADLLSGSDDCRRESGVCEAGIVGARVVDRVALVMLMVYYLS
jgi:hypothetical protein